MTDLSILDLSPVPAGGTAGDALRASIALAQAAERAGYRRYWVAEHHLVPGVASAAPAVLVGMIAAATSTIRVGSGAVLLPGPAPLTIAEQFGTVAAVHPGRVDLGLGRTDVGRLRARLSGPPPGRPAGPPPSDRVVDGLLVPAPPAVRMDLTRLLHQIALLDLDRDMPPYAEQVAEILSYVDGTATLPDGEPLVAQPAHGADLDLWILGSSPGASARLAGALGLPFAANYHVAPSGVVETVAAYRAAFRPGVLPRPHVMVSADVVVAGTDERARTLAAPYGQWVLDIRSGRGAQPYVTPEQARDRTWTDAERAAVADRIATQFVGSPATVVPQLATLARATGADELLLTTITADLADRVRSVELLAAVWTRQASAA